MISREAVVEALKKAQDPELNIDVWTLGLIYDIKLEEAKVGLRMTFTSPMCPYGPWLLEDVKSKVKQVPGVSDVAIEVVFDPPWQPSEEIKLMLGVQ